MPDRERALKALDEIVEITRGMNMGTFLYVAELATDIRSALTMLKEQEPRLLTLDEVCGGGEFWIEGINGACGYADCEYAFDNDSGIYDVEIYRTHGKTITSSKGFGKAWRGWSVKPTDEQRRAVKWDGARQSEGGGDSGD